MLQRILRYFIYIVSICLLCSTPVIAREELVVFTENSPPYQYAQGSNIEGLATAKVRKIVESAGYNAQIKIFPWARALLNVNRSSRALIYSMAKTPERLDDYHWIAPVATFNLGIITLANRHELAFDNLQSISNLSVAAQRADIAVTWLLNKGFVEGENLFLCSDIVCSWQHLKLGTVDFIIDDPNLIGDTAELVGLDVHGVAVRAKIEELSIQAYLAANPRMPKKIVERLLQAATALGYQ